MGADIATSRSRVRFWIESIVASLTGVLTVVTLFWHDWIEAVSGVDPDRGNGSVEWLVVALLVVVMAGSRPEWLRARRAERVTGAV
jgi:hypothetical protein